MATMDPVCSVEVRHEDFDLQQEYRALARPDCGACVLFVGLVRDLAPGAGDTRLELEHYPGMTERSIEVIVAEACARWQVDAVRVIHRVGLLAALDQIVLVGVASAHRGDAFAACEFIMDFLKTRALIWKKEGVGDRATWVEARDSDDQAARRWRRPEDLST